MTLKEIRVYRVSCRACDEIFCGLTLEEAKERHQKHIKKCPAITALEKVECFRVEAEKVLGREMTLKEAIKIVVNNN